MRTIHGLMALTLLGACDQEYGDLTIRSEQETFYQEPTNEIDILWIIDNSSSMAEEQAALAASFEDFAASIEETNTDFHIGVITTSFDSDDPDRGKLLGDPVNLDDTGGERPANPNVITRDDDYSNLFKQRVQVGTDGADKEQGLAAATYALSNIMTEGANAGFLRDEAFLLTVFVSDENDCSHDGNLDGADAGACYTESQELTSVSEFVYDMRNVKSNPNLMYFGGIIGPPSSELEGCANSVAPGARYRTFLEYFEGVEGSICESDFGDIMFDMGLNASGIRTAWELADTPRTDTIEVWVSEEGDTDVQNATEVSQSYTNGWAYNEESNYIVFYGDAIPERGATIFVAYDLASGR